MKADLAKLLEGIKPRFLSGNGVPVERAYLTQAEWAELLAIAEAAERDALRYRALRDIACCSMSLSCNEEHAPNYMTAAAWIEEFPETFADVPADELDAMKATNTIWTLQIYPNTPVGFNRCHGATMDAAIDRLLAIGEDG